LASSFEFDLKDRSIFYGSTSIYIQGGRKHGWVKNEESTMYDRPTLSEDTVASETSLMREEDGASLREKGKKRG
jgi:hypothetical protein